MLQPSAPLSAAQHEGDEAVAAVAEGGQRRRRHPDAALGVLALDAALRVEAVLLGPPRPVVTVSLLEALTSVKEGGGSGVRLVQRPDFHARGGRGTGFCSLERVAAPCEPLRSEDFLDFDLFGKGCRDPLGGAAVPRTPPLRRLFWIWSFVFVRGVPTNLTGV